MVTAARESGPKPAVRQRAGDGDQETVTAHQEAQDDGPSRIQRCVRAQRSHQVCCRVPHQGKVQFSVWKNDSNVINCWALF